MQIAICDDCKISAQNIYDVIATSQHIDASKIDIYFSANSLLTTISLDTSYDIVFLDIEMPEINGIELGKLIREKLPKTFIVFVTSFPQYAIEAYDCEAYHYLLKPINSSKVINIVCKIAQKIKERHKYHTIKIKGNTIFLPIKDIYFIECCQKHVIYHLKEKDYDTVGNISDANSQLKNYGFLQIHQGYIVNMDKISHINKLTIILTDKRSVPISVRKRTEVLAKYAMYMEEHY